MNKFLVDEGLTPSIVADPAVFGGLKTIKSLQAEIVAGQERYTDLRSEALRYRDRKKPVDAI